MFTKRVQKFDNNGKFIAVVAKPGADSASELPWLANTVDRNGNIYVGTFGGQLHKFDSSGKQIPGWGDNIKIIRAVFNLSTDDAGNLYVSDARPWVVKIHAIGTLLGEFVMPNPKAGTMGWDDGRLGRCTTTMHDSDARRRCATAMRDGDARRRCATAMRDGDARRRCATAMRDGDARRRCATAMRDGDARP